MRFERETKRQFFRFLIVGGVNTLFGYGLFCLLVALRFNHIIAISVAYVCGVFFNFQTTGRFVFRTHKNSLIIRFTCAYVILYFVNLGCIEFFRYFISNWYVNGALTTLVSAIVAFAFNKYWVFKV